MVYTLEITSPDDKKQELSFESKTIATHFYRALLPIARNEKYELVLNEFYNGCRTILAESADAYMFED